MNFPLFYPKCKREVLIDIKDQIILVIVWNDKVDRMLNQGQSRKNL